MRNFRNLNIWKDSITIVKKVNHLAELSKKAEIAELVNYINKIQKMINNLITKLKANS